ncbi:hypothetical protein A7311_00960 [Paenibacillus polymyxa]|uniref:helix-turn-helix domain-containing protein n=1 Tax=Paenibacillus TaxID=44249 RepID=UPI00083DE146|nr:MULTISPECIES: helix-turn-helix transcriptional regulator [Paenibacillus]KAF6564488.1 helix-turn-helix transcriptional regulator [Paenibacillus sp. EKM202P]KAF6571697.1 helix-turn-helix transcriptional regulator [Paenibacillus sp. EKM207P]KAF6578334.1 helix-turn-helix transcriptional regulator [Paenibacillus sp. EKM212P]ODB56926.1 hypothetical protein A7311_00960 [Paenibacillus polymyxa]
MNIIKGEIIKLLPDRLISLRKEKKLTQEKIAEKLGITRSAYSQYELGTRNPDHETLNKMADFHNASIDYLMGRTDIRTQILTEPSRELIDSLDLADEDIIKKFNFQVDGVELKEDEVHRFIAFVRAERAMKNKNHDSQNDGDDL